MIQLFQYVYGCSVTEHPLDLIDIVLQRSFCLPNKAIAAPIIKALLLAPIQHCSNSPLVHCWGDSGSGKSDLLRLASGLTKEPIYMASSSPASLRNAVQLQVFGRNWKSYGSAALKSRAKNYSILLIDDLDWNYFSGLNFNIAKCGYSQSTAWLSIADKAGTNLEFYCFALRIYASTHAFWINPKLIELKRRSLIIEHKYYQDMSEADRASNPDPIDLVRLDNVNFLGYQEHKKLIDSCTEKLDQAIAIKRELTEIVKAIAREDVTKFYEVLGDVLAWGVVNGVFDAEGAAWAMIDYWDTIQAPLYAMRDSVAEFLDMMICDHLKTLMRQPKNGYISVSKKEMNTIIESGKRSGDILPGERFNLEEKMISIGWKCQGSNFTRRAQEE